jgi:hypothetical protein
MAKYFELYLSIVGGGVGVLDRGKLATSRLTERDRIDPNVWSGDRLAPTEGTMALLQHMKPSKHLK